MTLTVVNPNQKSDVITILKSALSMLVFPRTDTKQKANIVNHINWMERQSEEMEVDCSIETFPETKATRLVITVRYGGRLATN